jgi:hypothetical protein
MAKETKIMTASINLPVECLNTIIDVDDRRFEVPIQDAIKKMEDENVSYIRSYNTLVTIPEEMENKKYVENEYISISNGCYFVNKIERKHVEKTNELRFFKLYVEFADGRTNTYVFPSFVKFYSMHKGTFIPVEFLKSRDLLYDYSGRMIRIEDAEEVTDFELTDFYNIKIAYEKDVETYDDRKIWFNFYINGILANVSYNNFQIKEKDSE